MEKICEGCNEKFETTRKNKKYCNRQCSIDSRKEDIYEYQKNYREKNKKKILIQKKIYHQRPDVKKRKSELGKEYRKLQRVKDKQSERGWIKNGIKNMNIERYKKILKEQNSCCSICGLHQDNFKKKLCVDHDHETGEVRGILCHKCNTSLTGFGENIDILASAISYLKQETSNV